jgi:hypothetical protein
VEFSIEYHSSFSILEWEFEAGLRGRLLEEIPLYIEMLFIEKELMQKRPNTTSNHKSVFRGRRRNHSPTTNECHVS